MAGLLICLFSLLIGNLLFPRLLNRPHGRMAGDLQVNKRQLLLLNLLMGLMSLMGGSGMFLVGVVDQMEMPVKSMSLHRGIVMAPYSVRRLYNAVQLLLSKANASDEFHQAVIMDRVVEAIKTAEKEYPELITEKLIEEKPSTIFSNDIFSIEFFRKYPALNSLKTIMNPNAELIRSCLLELAHAMINKKERQ